MVSRVDWNNMKNKFEIRFNDQVVIPDIGKFPGGEIRVRIPEFECGEVLIVAMVLNSDDVMTLVMLVDALREMGVYKIRLTMPYIPYARQDRVCNPGEAFSIRAFARIINGLDFASIVVFDPHSQVSTEKIERVIVKSQAELMQEHDELYAWICRGGWDMNPMYLVCPDKGATKKVLEIANRFPQFKGIIYAEKERDLATGKIIRTVVKDLPSDIADAKLLVADDICDGGRTFIELAKVLPECRDLSLYVTHGIFSAGMGVLKRNREDGLYKGYCPGFDNVWSTINFKEYK